MTAAADATEHIIARRNVQKDKNRQTGCKKTQLSSVPSQMQYLLVSCVLQGQLPCLTPEGKIIMASPHALAKAPDGNGGVYLALAK